MAQVSENTRIKDFFKAKALNDPNRHKLNLPNKITIARILTIPFFAFLLIHYRFSQNASEYIRYTFTSIFVLAVITDALDGFLARTLNMKTHLGAILDPIADKLLLLTTIIILSIPTLKSYSLPIWFTILIISRDIIIILGSTIIYMTKEELSVKPAIIGKITTFFQMLLIFWIFVRFPYTNSILLVTAVSTVFSGINYIKDGSRQLA